MTAATTTTSQSRGQTDYLLLSFVAILVLIGLQLVYSSTFALAITEYDNVAYFLIRQAIWAVIGGALLLLCMRMDYHVWRRFSPLLILGTIIVLVLVLVPGMGVDSYGAVRWLRLGPLPPVQPSEFVKLSVVIGLATWLSGPSYRLSELKRGVLPLVLFLGIITALIMKEPDMGSTLVILLTAGTMFFLAGGNLRLVATAAIAAVSGVAVFTVTAAYRAERWLSFLDPWGDPSGLGFHIIQLLIALGSGGVFGLGPGASRQKFFYVPGAHTDGIFAILGEEMGFVGCVVVLFLFAAVVYRGARIATHAPDKYGALLALGIISWIAYQALINIGGITHSIPLTGIPLPFLSYGGSALAATMAAVGILLSIARATNAAAVAGHTPETPSLGRRR